MFVGRGGAEAVRAVIAVRPASTLLLAAAADVAERLAADRAAAAAAAVRVRRAVRDGSLRLGKLSESAAAQLAGRPFDGRASQLGVGQRLRPFRVVVWARRHSSNLDHAAVPSLTYLARSEGSSCRSLYRQY